MRLIPGAIAALAIAGCPVPATRGPAPVPMATGQVVLRFKDDVTAKNRDQVRTRFGAVVEAGVLAGTERWFIPGGTEAEVVSALRSDGAIKHAAPNYVRHVLGYSAADLDGGEAGQWAVLQVHAPEAWDQYFTAESPPGHGIMVAVIDSGVDVRHPDLAANIAKIGGMPRFIDVLHDASHSSDVRCGANYDWVTAYADTAHPGPDGHGHGTHVAGIVAAVGNNFGVTGTKMVGVAPGATILPVKTMDCAGDGTDWDIAHGIKDAADAGARIQNLSIGGPEPGPILEEAISYARAKGGLMIVAAGNGFGAPVFYPAAYAGVLAVGAVDRNDAYQGYSNVGPELAMVAPGGTSDQKREGINSTLPSYGSKLGKHYGRVSGTSQASPLVAGIAALIWSREPSLSADQVRSRLVASAKDLGPKGFDAEYGFGRVDALESLKLGDHRFGP